MDPQSGQVTAVIASERNSLRTAIRFQVITIGWMVFESAAAIGAAIAAGSLLLVTFRIDSVIELNSAIVVFRRCRMERLPSFTPEALS